MLRPACNQCAGLFEKWLEEEEEEEEEEWVQGWSFKEVVVMEEVVAEDECTIHHERKQKQKLLTWASF